MRKVLRIGEKGKVKLERGEREAISDLQSKVAPAVASLEEGLKETLSLHRLGLFTALGKSFKTTNCIESLMSQVGQYTGKVDYWKNSSQKRRWVSSALLEIESRLRRVKGHRHLFRFREALKKELNTVKQAAKKNVL